MKTGTINYDNLHHNVVVLEKLEKILGSNEIASGYKILIERSKQRDEMLNALIEEILTFYDNGKAQNLSTIETMIYERHCDLIENATGMTWDKIKKEC